MLVLNVIAVKAVHGLTWSKAALSSVALWGLLCCVVGGVIMVILALLGPAMGNVFSNMVTAIALTPTP